MWIKMWGALRAFMCKGTTQQHGNLLLTSDTVNYLIVGLGNIGDEYARTRHNIGFRVLDALAGASNLAFDDKRYGFVTTLKVKNQTLILLKPSTYMNLSGNAVRYWMNEMKIPVERFGIGNDFPRGGQVDYVLGEFGEEDLKTMDERLKVAGEAVKTFCLAGINVAMNQFNNK